MVLGIDLGTTYSVAAIFHGEEVTLIPNRFGEVFTPSVVGLDDDGSVIVGKLAKERLLTHPEATAALFKREMGSAQKHKLNARAFSPVELSALVLASLKKDVEAFAKESIDKVIVSVPAYFSDAQRKATINAAKLAGLEVERLINEPTAAAIAYGLQERPENSRFIVLDLGGGTFDVSIMEYFEGVLEVHASAGDCFLGGQDFTDAIANSYLDKAKLTKSSLARQELRSLERAAEIVKRLLSDQETVEIAPQGAAFSETILLSRSTFNELTAALLKRLRAPIERAMRDARLTVGQIDEVVLVGGATRMREFRAMAARMFRRMPATNIDPDTVVARGAAMQAALLNEDRALEEVILTDVCPHSLGIGVHNEADSSGRLGNLFSPIIERNTTVPVSIEQTYVTVSDNQKEITVPIYQGESRYVNNNVFLGQLSARVPKAMAGQEAVTVRFSYDSNGILDVDVSVVTTGKEYNKVITQRPGDVGDKEMESSLRRLSKLKFHPREHEHNRELLVRAERLHEELLGEERAVIAQWLAQFDHILEKQDLREIEQARKELSSLLDQISPTLSL